MPEGHYIRHQRLVQTDEEVCVAEELRVDETVFPRVSGWSEKEIRFGFLEGERYCAGAVG